MPRKVLPRIAAVSPGEEPMTLRLRWDAGSESIVDLSGMIERFKVYAPLRQSPEFSGKCGSANTGLTSCGPTRSTCRPTPSGGSLGNRLGKA